MTETRIPPLTFKAEIPDGWGDRCDWIESEDGSVKLWFEAGDVDPNLLRLFAAAPSLLAALELLQDFYTARGNDEFVEKHGRNIFAKQVHDAARAAIAKAQGDA